MKPPSLAVHLLLALVLGLVSCSRQGDVEESAHEYISSLELAIRNVIPDQDRAERLAGYQAVVGEEVRKYYQAYSFAQDDARRVNADYDSTPDAFERIADGLAKDRQRTSDAIIRIAMRLRSEMSPEEWAKVSEEVR